MGDILSELRILAMPKWLKGVISGALVSIVAASIAIGVLGMIRSDRTSWVEAAAYAMGISLPPFILGAVLFFSTTGTAALVGRTITILEVTLPETLARIPYISNLGSTDAEVETHLEASGFSALYEIRLSDRESRILTLSLRVELNVKKANVILHIDPTVLSEIASGVVPDASSPLTAFSSIFQNTLGGAMAEGYNPAGVVSASPHKNVLAFFLARQLPDNFLWDSGEQLYFAQDLVMMLSGFARERPEMFARPVTAAGITR